MIPGLHKRVFNFHDIVLYIALVRKHLRLMVLLICMCMLAGLAVYLYSRPVYTSRSLVQVDELALPEDSDTVYHDSSLANVIAQLQSPQIIERTAHRLGVDAGFREIEAKYLKQLRIGPSPEGSGLEVVVFAYNQAWTVRWTELMVEEFTKARQEYRQKYRDDVTKSWGDVVGEAGKNMDQNIDSRFNTLDQSKLLNAQIDMNRLSNVPIQLAQAKQRIDAIDQVMRKLDDPALDTVAKLSLIDSVTAAAPLRVGQVIVQTGSVSGDQQGVGAGNSTEAVVEPDAVAPSTWAVLDTEQRHIKQEIAQASATLKPGNRKMIALFSQLQAVNKNLDFEYESARNRLTLERQSLADQEVELNRKMPEYMEMNHKYAKLQQDNQLREAGDLAWQNIYTGAEKYIKELDYTADKERVNLHYGRLLEARADPVSPNRGRLAALSLAAGLALALIVPFLIEYLDFTLTNIEQVEATFRIRGLGIVPQLSRDENSFLLSGGGQPDPDGTLNVVESFRLVRTNLLAMGSLSKPPHVMMVTSAMPREGKTIVSSNLAVSFGQMNERTLLVDTDLRRGRLHLLFGLRKSPGLSDVLMGKVPLEDALRPSGKENLTILSAGQHLEFGTELLGSAKFTELMQELRGRYDRIIVDTPPVLGLSETSILQNHVDGILFVIWSGRTPIQTVKTAVDILSANNANFYGFVLNRLDLSSTANYYQYYYYSSEYYQTYHALENV